MRVDNRVLIKTVADSGAVRFIEVGWFKVSTDSVYSDRSSYIEFCKNGCKNYTLNGGCPPLSPDFELLRKHYAFMIVVWTRIQCEQLPERMTHDPKINKKYYYAVSIVQSMLPPVMKHIYDNTKDIWKPDMYLGESSCKVCGKRSCVFNQPDMTLEERKKLKCRHPKDRVFSLESTGIDVDRLMRLGAFPLYWYGRTKTITDVPYTIKATGYLFKTETPNRDLTQDIVDVMNTKKSSRAWKFEEVMNHVSS